MSPFDTLRQRLASGDITPDQYRELSALLAEGESEPSNSPHPDKSLGKLVFEFEGLELYEKGGFRCNGKDYSYASVTSVSGGQYSFTINGITDRTSDLTIEVEGGNTFTTRETGGFFKRKRHAGILTAFARVRLLTFDVRLQRFVQQLARARAIALADRAVRSSEPVVLHVDGTLSSGDIRVSIREAKEDGTFALGTSWASFSSANSRASPDEIFVSSRKPFLGQFPKKDSIRFTPSLVNPDLAQALIAWMAKTGNSLVDKLAANAPEYKEGRRTKFGDR